MKKPFLVIAAVFLTALTPAAPMAGTKVYIDLSAPAEKMLPIAIREFEYAGPDEAKASEGPVGQEIMAALKDDLRFSGLFSIVKNGGPDLRAGSPGEAAFGRCRDAGADILVTGSFSTGKDGLGVEVRLFDCVNEKRIMGKRYIGPGSNPRRLIHYFADELYEALTGRKGIFSTRLLFVSDMTGSKEVYMSDYDGKNAVRVTKNSSINLSPQWSPDAKRLIYSSYKNGQPRLYMLSLRTGKETMVSARAGINIGARFSPFGDEVALTLSGDKSPELHVLNLNTNSYRQLTSNYGIDVSPTWSPDGNAIAYVSDISGNPHIFVITLGETKAKRLTFDGIYNASPAWSPDGKKIAFSRSDSGPFNIWVMNSDGSNATQLTFEGSNSAPSWSPDGRYIVFSSVYGGRAALHIMRATGEGLIRIQTNGNATAPAWSPYLN